MAVFWISGYGNRRSGSRAAGTPDSFVENRSMTLKTKFSLLIPASCMLILAFLAMQNVYGRAFILFLILFKYVYFFTKIRTIPAGQTNMPEAEG